MERMTHRGRSARRWAGGLLLMVAVLAPQRSVCGQVPAGPFLQADAESKEQITDDAAIWVERSVLQRLNLAKVLIESQRYAEAVRYLGAILEAPEDYFVQSTDKSHVDRSLKAEANRLIGQMPAAGRESYELQYGARARQLFSEAVDTHNANGLAEVSRQFFHTQAGYQATLVLGLDDLDRGRPLAGALTLRRLRDVGAEADQFEPTLSLAMAACWLQSGMTAEAQRTLVALKERRAAATLTVAGREVPVFRKNEDAVTWLTSLVGQRRPSGARQADGWLMARADPARDGIVSGGTPLLSLRWRVPLTDEPVIEEFLQQRYQGLRDQGIPEACSLHPLAVDNVVLMRTVRNLLAVDFQTGKRLWEVPVEDRFESLLGGAGAAGDSPFPQLPQLAANLEQRVWEDYTFGTLSSDGQLVFSIEDLGWGPQVPESRRVIINGRSQRDAAESKPFNRLAAHQIRTGKLRWHVGGAAGQYALRLPEVFFLGPPLPLGGRLYVLAESKEEIRLLVLEAESGNLVWSQQLGMVEQNVQQDPFRRCGGIAPSYADGVLVCPTASGAIIGVELATRSLLWRYRYGRSRDGIRDHGFGNRRLAIIRGDEPGGRWFDTSIAINKGRVIVSPLESSEVHCLNLIDGSVLWKQPRQEDLFLAGVVDDRVVLVGQRRLRAMRLDNGRSAWESNVGNYPEGAVPSGRGFISGKTYYLPLSTAEVDAFNMQTGALEVAAKSREGLVPGNLIAYQGRIISQGVDGAESFYQLDALEREIKQRLAAKADDAEALALQGEILIDRGQRDDAIGVLRRSYRIDPQLRTRELLRDALLDGLRRDFVAYRDQAGEVEQLLDDVQQRATYLRLMAVGLQQTGQWRDALERYRSMMEMGRNDRELETVDRGLSVRPSRWIQNQLQALRRSAGPDEGAAIDRFISEQWSAASKAGTLAALRRFLEHFGSHPTAVAARRLLLEQLLQAGRLLEAELLLWGDQTSSDAQRSAEAVAQMAAMLRKADRGADAARLYGLLKTRYADVVAADGKTGAQLVANLPADDAARKLLDEQDPWLHGKVDWKRSTTARNRPTSYSRVPIDFVQGQLPFFADNTLQFDQSRGLIVGRNGWGAVKWNLSPTELQRVGGFGYNGGTTAHARGHLLVLALDSRIVALDTLDRKSGGAPRVLWAKELSDAAPRGAGFPRVFGGQMIANQLAWGIDPFRSPAQMACALGPVTENYLCYLRGRECIAVDPVSGDTLWIRRDLPPWRQDPQPQRSLFGDGEYIFIRMQEKAEAVVLDARDGTLLGRRKMPRVDEENCLGMLGRNLLIARPKLAGFAIELFDPWEQKAVWTSPRFEHNARFAVLDQDAVGVYEPNGHFRLLRTADGGTLIDAQLRPESALAAIHLVELGQQRILVTNRNIVRAEPEPSQPMPSMVHRAIASGLVYAFDREGKTLWPQPVSIENQHLLMDQPTQLPVVVFACQVYQRQDNNGGQYNTAILCIDKQTGRVAYRDKLPFSTTTFDISGDPRKNLVELALHSHPMRQIVIQLTFTDKPIPPGEDKESADDADQEAPKKGLLDSILKALRSTRKPGADQPAANQAPPAAKPEAQPAPAKPPPAEKPAPPAEKPADGKEDK